MALNWQTVEKLVPLGSSRKQVKVRCPECDSRRSDKKDKSLAVNLDDKTFFCHYCGEKGGESPHDKEDENIKPIEVPTVAPVNKTSVEWFDTRKISLATLSHFKISQSSTEIHFNYYYKGQIVNIKYRQFATKKFRAVAGAAQVPFNIDCVEAGDTVVITEGEIDAMSVFEAHPKAKAISVPSGAQGIDWIDKVWPVLNTASKFIIATDGDEKGIKYRDELANRLGKHRCKFVEYPTGTKDLNEVLMTLGKKEVLESLKNSKHFPIEGIHSLSNFDDELKKVWEFGHDEGDRAGLGDFDDLLRFTTGQLTIVTGVPSSGKSEFLDQLMINLAFRMPTSQVKIDWKFGVLSWENNPIHLHVIKLASKLTGRAFGKGTMTKSALDSAVAQIDDKFKFYNIDSMESTIENILNVAIQLVDVFGVNCILIDPYNYIVNNTNAINETSYISDLLSKIVTFAKTRNVHVIMVAHPTKIMKQEDGNYKVPDLYSISGSAHWFNKADNGLVVWRDFNTGLIKVYVQKVRFKWNGKLGDAEFEYVVNTGQYIPR